MTETYVSYTPGHSTLLARNGSFLLLETSPTHPAVGQVWTALGTTDATESALSTLAHLLPGVPFCLVQVSGSGVAVARHALSAVLDGRPVIAAEELVPVPVPSYGGILMTATAQDSAGKQQLPFEAGVVAADALMVVQVGDDIPAATAPPQQADPEDLQAPVEAAPSPDLWDGVPPLDEPADAPAPVEFPAPLGSGEAPGSESLEGPVGDPVTDLGDLGGLRDAAPPVPGTAWGLTRHPSTDVPTALAGYCLDGHLSPAQEELCRSCGSPMPQQTPARIERPVLGALVLADGRTIELDRDAVLGRAPRIPEGSTTEPHLINLAPFGRDVSRQHAEVVLGDWDVAVRDLGSVNGTRVLHPSGETVVAEEGTLVPLQPGSRIEVAEVTTLTYQRS